MKTNYKLYVAKNGEKSIYIDDKKITNPTEIMDFVKKSIYKEVRENAISNHPEDITLWKELISQFVNYINIENIDTVMKQNVCSDIYVLARTIATKVSKRYSEKGKYAKLEGNTPLEKKESYEKLIEKYDSYFN